MKHFLLLVIATLLLSTSCKKDRQSRYHQAIVLKGSNSCRTGTWIKLSNTIRVPSAGSSDTFNAINLQDTYNVPGKQIQVTFDFEQPEVCTAFGLEYPSIKITDIK
jgi:hypothetical protein